jgi:hypothetical protein
VRMKEQLAETKSRVKHVSEPNYFDTLYSC